MKDAEKPKKRSPRSSLQIPCFITDLLVSLRSMDTSGHLWSMETNGDKCTQMGTNGHKLAQEDKNGHNWTHMKIK